VQTTNASKCIQFLRPSIPKDESALYKLMIRQSLTGCVLGSVNYTKALTSDVVECCVDYTILYCERLD